MRALMTLVAIGLAAAATVSAAPQRGFKDGLGLPVPHAVADPANRAAGGSGADSHPLGTAEAPCIADSTTLCIDDQPGDHRFEIGVHYSSPDRALNGNGSAIPLSPLGITQGGAFAFFSTTNPEMLVKVLNACGEFQRYWVFFAATTDVGFTTTVRDTVAGSIRTYSNPDHQAALPVQDTNAFSCSPASIAQAAHAGLLSDRVSAGLETTNVVSTAINFPTTAVGNSSTVPCGNVCFGTRPQCNQGGTVTLDQNVSAPFSVVNLRRHTGEILSGSDCTGTAVAFPVTLAAGQELVMDFKFAPTSPGTFSDTLITSGLDWDLKGATPGAGQACTPSSTTLCIDNQPGDQRFEIKVNYSSPDRSLSGDASAINLSSVGITQGGAFAFFSNSNPELLVKVLNGCSDGNHYWVFFAAVTDVGFTVTVRDTVGGTTRTYTNADHHAASPVQDTSAFSCN